MSRQVALSFDKRVNSGRQSGNAFAFSDGSIEAVKWLALVLMTGDHINAYLLNWNERWLFAAGRLVMPLFGVMLAYNLARNGLTAATRIRMMQRMMTFSVLAMPAYIYKHGYWPVNILATLCLFVFIVHCVEKQTPQHNVLAVVAFVFGGAVVEFWWFALTVCLSAWFYFKSPTNIRALLLAVSIFFLAVVNRNYYALASLPILLAASIVHVRLPRCGRVFYIYYPLHLTVLTALCMWQTRN